MKEFLRFENLHKMFLSIFESDWTLIALTVSSHSAIDFSFNVLSVSHTV